MIYTLIDWVSDPALFHTSLLQQQLSDTADDGGSSLRAVPLASFPIIYESHALDFGAQWNVMPAQLYGLYNISWVNIQEPNQLGHI